MKVGRLLRDGKTTLNIRERLSVCADLLEQIDRHRARTSDYGRGASIEQRIIERELRELEADILADPGPLETQLVRIRRQRASR